MTILAMNEMVAKQKAELASAQAEHDKAANESALRLTLHDSVKKELDARRDTLNQREDDLIQREQTVAAVQSQFQAALRSLGLVSS